MRRLVREIHRRSMWQVLGIYLAGSWVALEVTAQLAESLALPPWVSPFAVVLLVIGFPIVMATAFVQEGVGASAEVPVDEANDASAPAAIAHPQDPPANDREPSDARRLLTWRNALAGGVLAFALLGLVTAAWIVARSLGIGPAGSLVAKGVLEEKATVLIAEFSSPDSMLARAATEAFTIDFSTSSVVRVADPAVVAGAMGRMQLPAAAKLTPEFARELAEREGIPALITGEITPVGSGYVLSARLISLSDEEVLDQQRQSATGEDKILDAIDRLSKGMRERVGDPLRDIGSSAPLAQVTTPSLEALRLYSVGAALLRGEGPSDRAEALMQEALERDSAFAMAWRALAIVYQSRGQEPAGMVGALRKAFEFQDRLTRRERHMARAAYFSNVTYEFDRAALEYEALLESDPHDLVALNNLAVDYMELREFDRAEELFERAVGNDSSITALGNLAETRALRGRFGQAHAVVDRMRGLFLESAVPDWYEAHILATEERYDEAVEAMGEALTGVPAGSSVRALVQSDLASLAASRGALAGAAGHLEAAEAINSERGLAFSYLLNGIQGAWIEASVRNDEATARARLDRGLERYPLETLDPLDRPYLALAELYAYLGDVESAKAMYGGFRESIPEELQAGQRSATLRAEAAIALAEGRAEEAVRLYRDSDTGYCLLCALPGLAMALEAAGDLEGAIGTWRKYVDTPWLYRTFGNQYQQGPRLGPSLAQLGRLYDEQGDRENAAVYYARFVDLWRDADPGLQPRVEAARERLQDIVRERG